MSRSLCVFIICAGLTACVTGQPSTRESERAVEQASDDFFATRQRGDATAFAQRFTEDGIYMVPGVVDASGRNAVQELARKRFAGGATEDFRVHRRETEVVGDSAYELAWFSETSKTHRLQGRHFILWRRGSDEVWRVQRYFYNFSDAAPLP